MPAEGQVRDGNTADFQLIETLRWEPESGFVRLDLHLARLYGSAHQLGFACDPQRVGEALATVGSDASLRTRLTLARNGGVSVATQPYEPVPDGITWKLKIAATRLDPADPLLVHKTTRRDSYIAARAEFPVWQADEVLLLDSDGMVCEGTITNLFVAQEDGPLVTPALSCGLLPGVFRQTLLDEGKAVEGKIFPPDLRRADSLYVGNSLRGLIRATLADG